MYRHQYIHNTVHCIGICIYPLHLTTYNTHVQTSIYIHILYIHCIGIMYIHCIGICIYPLHLTTYNTHVQTSIYIHILYIHCIGIMYIHCIGICIYPLHLSIHCMYIYRCVGYLIHNGKLCRKELSIPDIPSHKLVSIFTTNCCPCTVVPPPPLTQGPIIFVPDVSPEKLAAAEAEAILTAQSANTKKVTIATIITIIFQNFNVCD